MYYQYSIVIMRLHLFISFDYDILVLFNYNVSLFI